jgi:hypothetical protein
MAGVEDTNVVDLVARDAGGEYMVVMVESRQWGSDSNQPDQLKEKINAYAGYILNGDLARQFPEAAGQPARIQLDCPELNGEITVITEWAGLQLREHGIGFVVNARAQTA